jgi:hypothetical protein
LRYISIILDFWCGAVCPNWLVVMQFCMEAVRIRIWLSHIAAKAVIGDAYAARLKARP